MSYRILILPRADRELDALPLQQQERVSEAIDRLAENPRPPGCVKMKGVQAWRIRAGDYRVVYEVEDGGKVVRIMQVGHRKDVYR